MSTPTATGVFRSRIADRIGSLFDEQSAKMGAYVEKGVFNYAVREAGLRKVLKKWDNPAFTQIYLIRLNSIMTNLESSSELRNQLLSGGITPEQLSKMTHQEFRPELWKNAIERKVLRDASKLVDAVVPSTDMFTCRKCRSKKCTYYEMQTRSADESATLFVSCTQCGNAWRQ